MNVLSTSCVPGNSSTIAIENVSNPCATLSVGLTALPAGPRNIELWTIDLLAYPFQNHEMWLSRDETARAARFIFEDDRRRYRAAHCALREILAQRLARHATSVVFHAGRHGKPSIAQAENTLESCRFNLSHSGDVALLGIVDYVEIGVDIEKLREFDDIWQLAEQNFTSREYWELSDTPAHERSRAFLRGWTRKEACLKALGCGLMVPPRSFHVGLSKQSALAELRTEEESVQVQVENIDVGIGYVAATAWVTTYSKLAHCTK